jgi:hypothetical protein
MAIPGLFRPVELGGGVLIDARSTLFHTISCSTAQISSSE